jgi:multidrug efflux pump subunit AcrA (membrane-fusion protein)
MFIRSWVKYVSCLFAVCAILACHEKTAVGSSGFHSESASVVSSAVENILRIRGTCVIRSATVVRLKAQIGGEVKTVLVQQGEQVRQNQVLATIDIEDLKVRRARTKIELEKLVRRAELLRFQITRAEKEFSVIQEISGSVSSFLPQFGKEKAALLERHSDLEENELNQGLGRLDLQTIDVQIQRSAIRAPFSGVVLARSVEPGMVIGSGSQSVGGGEVLFEIADPTRLIAACIVKESDALHLKKGATATVLIEGEGTMPLIARIRDVSPIITSDAGISRREFTVQFDSHGAKGLLPGMNAEVDVGN